MVIYCMFVYASVLKVTAIKITIVAYMGAIMSLKVLIDVNIHHSIAIYNR